MFKFKFLQVTTAAVGLFVSSFAFAQCDDPGLERAITSADPQAYSAPLGVTVAVIARDIGFGVVGVEIIEKKDGQAAWCWKRGAGNYVFPVADWPATRAQMVNKINAELTIAYPGGTAPPAPDIPADATQLRAWLRAYAVMSTANGQFAIQFIR